MRILTQPPTLTGLPVPLRGIVARTLAKDPAERPTARELLDQLLAADPPAGAAPTRPIPPRAVPPDPARPAPIDPHTPMQGSGEEAGRPHRRVLKRVSIAVVTLAALLFAGLLGYSLLPASGADLGGAGDIASSAGAPRTSTGSPKPSPTQTGNAAILAGTRRTLIHFVEKDKDLALPFPDEVVASDGTGKDALFALVPVGVDYMIKSLQPAQGEQPCLGVKFNPTGSASLVGTDCGATKATLFSITPTRKQDDKGRPTYTIFNDDNGLVQWAEASSEIYVEFPGDAPPNATFSFVDRGPIEK
jgi:hypothetical protein